MYQWLCFAQHAKLINVNLDSFLSGPGHANLAFEFGYGAMHDTNYENGKLVKNLVGTHPLRYCLSPPVPSRIITRHLLNE